MKKVKSISFDVMVKGEDREDINKKIEKLKDELYEQVNTDYMIEAGNIFIEDLTDIYEKNYPDVFQYLGE